MEHYVYIITETWKLSKLDSVFWIESKLVVICWGLWKKSNAQQWNEGEQ